MTLALERVVIFYEGYRYVGMAPSKYKRQTLKSVCDQHSFLGWVLVARDRMGHLRSSGDAEALTERLRARSMPNCRRDDPTFSTWVAQVTFIETPCGLNLLDIQGTAFQQGLESVASNSARNNR